MDIKTTIELNKLIDLYGEFLTQKQLQVMKDYYVFDYSLSEIADNLKISRQAVNYTIKLATETLYDCEKKLHLNDKIEKVKNALKEINVDDDSKKKIEFAINILEE